MNSNIKYSSKTHQHSTQLGNLKYLCDDVLGVVVDFLPNSDLHSMIQISKSYLFKLFLHKRYTNFKQHRREKLEHIFSLREPNYQFANLVFKKRTCIIANCNNTNTTLNYFKPKNIYVPYCAICWLDKANISICWLDKIVSRYN